MTYCPTNQQQKQFLCKDPLSFLDEENFRKYHVELAHALKSIHAAIFLAELANRRNYHRMYGHDFLEFEEKSWFYYSHETGHERLAMSRKEQDTAIKILLEFGLIAQVNKTVPQTRFFYIYEDVVLSLFGLSKIVSKMTETDKLDCSKKDYRMTETDKLERPKGANCTYIERERLKSLNRDKGFAPVEAETPPVEVEERAAIAANGSDQIFYRGNDGMHSVKRETFDAAIREKRPDCSEAEISVAWEVLRQYKNKVSNVWGFAIRVIDNQRVDKMKKPPASVKPEAKKPIETEVNVCQQKQEVKPMDPAERKFLLENMGNPRYREQTPEQMIEDFRERKRKMQADTQPNTCKKN